MCASSPRPTAICARWLQDGRFRDDLYYRINVLSIDVPPLRERRDDIPVLMDFFLKKHTRNTSRLVRGLTPDARRS